MSEVPLYPESWTWMPALFSRSVLLTVGKGSGGQTTSPTTPWLASAPYFIHPTPYTLHPTPYSLHPTPYTRLPAMAGKRALLHTPYTS